MPKSTATCNSILALIFNATAWADLAQNDGSSPATNLYLSLHTADPGVGNDQTTNETAYTNYVRIAVARTTGGWDVPASGATANAALAQFAQCGVTGATLTHVAIGTASSGATSTSPAKRAGRSPARNGSLSLASRMGIGLRIRGFCRSRRAHCRHETISSGRVTQAFQWRAASTARPALRGRVR